jgi:hypothetical protein
VGRSRARASSACVRACACAHATQAAAPQVEQLLAEVAAAREELTQRQLEAAAQLEAAEARAAEAERQVAEACEALGQLQARLDELGAPSAASAAGEGWEGEGGLQQMLAEAG